MQRIESFVNFGPEANVNTLRVKWTEIPLEARRWYWPGLMLGFLANRPGDALKFLVATCADPLPHGNYMQDCLDYIVEYHLYRQSRSPISTEDFAALFGVINDLLTQFQQGEITLSEYAIYHICRHADRIQTETLYKTLVSRRQQLSLPCRLHFVDDLARRGATDSAVTVLRSIHNIGVDFTEPRVESVCATLLRCSQQDPDAVASESEIFSLLLQWGLRPGINFYNILARNSFESGDHETAWKIYDMLMENGNEPSHNTYSMFLNDAKLRRDHEAMEHILETVKANNIRNEYISTDLLHAVWDMHQSRSKEFSAEDPDDLLKSLWQRMLLIYNTYFESGPLEDFAPEYFTTSGKPSPEVEGGKMHPDFPTLALMITIAIQCRIEQSKLPQLYGRFKRLVEDGHPDFVRVATQTHVFDAFIKASGKHPQTLPFSARILGDMLSADKSASNRQEKAQSADKLPESPGARGAMDKRIASPSIYTWSTLVQAFMRHGQPRAAEKIVEMMKSRGTKPNEIIWSTLIVGYSQMQDIDSAMDSLNRATMGGWTIDGSVLSYLGPIRNRAELARQPQTVPRSSGAEEPSVKSRAQTDGIDGSSPRPRLSVSRHTLSAPGSPFDETKMFLLAVESERARIEIESRNLLNRAKRYPKFVRERIEDLRIARKRLEELQILVDGRLNR